MLRQFIQSLLGSLSALSLSACSPVTVLNAMVPESGYQHQADLIYGDHPRLKLDIYQPVNSTATRKPATVIFFYGGGWEDGEKADYKFVAEALTSQESSWLFLITESILKSYSLNLSKMLLNQWPDQTAYCRVWR